MPLPQALTGETWAVKTAVAMLPLLVRCAKRGQTVTYGELDREIVRRGLGHHVHAAAYGHAAGAVGDALVETEEEWGTQIPPLNALVVNAQTGIPGSGCDWYLLHVLRRPQRGITEHQRRALAEAVREMVFNFDRWDELLTEYGLRPIPEGRGKHRPRGASGKRIR